MIKDDTKITSYDELLAEKDKLEKQIEAQKNIIRHDLDELKLQFKKEIRPAIEAANFVKQFAAPQKRSTMALTFGTNLVIDVIFNALFPKSGLIFKTFFPRLLKNYTSNFLYRRANGANGQVSKRSTPPAS